MSGAMANRRSADEQKRKQLALTQVQPAEPKADSPPPEAPPKAPSEKKPTARKRSS